MSAALPLPPLTPDEAAHSRRLVNRIWEEIDARNGWLSFERFMEMALYEPGLGYYSAGASKLGAGGDFVTAPEVSSLFSRCLATQCVEILQHVSGGAILEFGAGSGVMAADLLNELAVTGSLPERYLILEVSADLRERQRALVQERARAHAARVEWLDRLPDEFRGVVLANEVLDALPVQRFRIRGDQVNALGVTWQLGRLDWSETHADAELEAAVRRIEANTGERLPDGYTSEINMRLMPWIAGVAAALREGVALFIDYGLPQRQYYRSERREGTLLCHFRHRFHDDPLINVGVQDIGAWVDFTAVAEAASAAGLAVAGFSTQAHFLIGNGLEQLLAPAAGHELASRVQLARQAMLLTLPGEMGERFKVIGLSRGIEQPLRGFGVRDLAATL
ncbi:MAG TPA: SAM-dependent methyltransferase [Steroidobacteraceae bacterium]|jgi:SAM-dependent MidA family methyltransferase|nr:SAM-dependent methyltransferase [Steroidobacteraceae bacterium]